MSRADDAVRGHFCVYILPTGRKKITVNKERAVAAAARRMLALIAHAERMSPFGNIKLGEGARLNWNDCETAGDIYGREV